MPSPFGAIMIMVKPKKISIIPITETRRTIRFRIPITGIGLIRAIPSEKEDSNMFKFNHWKQLIEEGHEVEFTYEGKRYSVTYPSRRKFVISEKGESQVAVE
jgi:hypothetical protein